MLNFIEVMGHTGEKRLISLNHVIQLRPSEGHDWSMGLKIYLEGGESFHLALGETARVLGLLHGRA